jgi:lipoate synthase
MQEKRVTAEQLLAVLGGDFERMVQKVVDAINHAQAGAIIDQSEEPVREAHAELRQATYQKALSLLEHNQQAFSPSAASAGGPLEKQRPAKDLLSDG